MIINSTTLLHQNIIKNMIELIVRALKQIIFREFMWTLSKQKYTLRAYTGLHCTQLNAQSIRSVAS